VRRIVIWLASTVTVVVLLFGYHTSTNTPATASGSTSTSAPAAPSSTPSATAPPDPSPSASASGSSSSPGSSTGTKTYTGGSADTRWGPVQVAITVTDGTITKVDVPVSPSGNGRDLEINQRALPELVQETLDAQSADIDMVSGATVTSDGYVTSLQSALDQAGI
jgi:uncharacterized protein with FMN-binding domain